MFGSGAFIMLRISLFFSFLILTFSVEAQRGTLSGFQIRLPDSLAIGGREISGLATANERIYFLAENRDDYLKIPSSGVYSVSLEEMERGIRNPEKGIVSYRYHPINGIERVMRKLKGYQGLEALAFLGDRFFMSIETELDADSCYIVSGRFDGNGFELDSNQVIPLKKPVFESGQKVFNAGFESLSVHKGSLFAFFEFNGFTENYAYKINTKNFEVHRLLLDRKVPFRITDVADWSGRKVVGINYFFPLKAEAVYQLDLNESEKGLIGLDSGKPHPFARLAVFRIKRNKMKVKRYLNLPGDWWTSNWEGIVRYGNGVLMTNDKFIKSGGQETQLIFLHLKGNR